MNEPTYLKTIPDHRAVETEIIRLKKCYPFLKVFPIGRSALGRNIYAVSAGKRRKCGLYVGATHGLEWLTSLVLLRFIGQVCEGLLGKGSLRGEALEKAIERRGLCVVPVLNPDGVEIALKGNSAWQANARGVDLNRNFAAGFDLAKEIAAQAGYTQPGPTRYGGPFPESEPETRAVVSFAKETDAARLYSFHSQGGQIFYSYGKHTPAQSHLMARLLAEASGYAVSAPEPIAAHGGLKDWYIEAFRRPGFTIEIGKGQNPLPIEEFEPIYARLFDMLAVSLII